MRDLAEGFRARHPGTALAPYPGSQQAPVFVTIPDNASAISGMTPLSEPTRRIWYYFPDLPFLPKSGPA